MSKKLFEDLKIYCPVCTHFMGKFTPNMPLKVFFCPNCKSRFEIQGEIADWSVGGESSKKGISFKMGISATVDNEIDVQKLKQYNNGYKLF